MTVVPQPVEARGAAVRSLGFVMLKFVSIENFALINHLEVEFSPGLNVITGETGSGKSILVDAVGLLVGERASQEMVRQGSDKARVEGIFHLPSQHPASSSLHDIGIPLENDELIVRREISVSGSNKVFINNVLVPLGTLTEIGTLLADIHGQHEQQHLLRPSVQLEFLDAFCDNTPQLQQVRECFGQLSQVRSEIGRIEAGEQDKLQRLDTLEFQIADINKLQLTPGLDIKLKEEQALLGSAEKRAQASQQAYQSLYEEEGSSLSLLHRVEQDLEELASLDPTQKSLAVTIHELKYRLEEIAFRLRDYVNEIAFDPARLEAVEEQLADIGKARRRYGDSVDDILVYLEEIQKEVEELAVRESRIEELKREEDTLSAHYADLADRLSQRRQSGAKKLSRQVERELADLNMENALFTIQLTNDPNYATEKGLDQLQFLISANPGEAPQPIARIASGGELSRTVLALKSILTLEDYSKTLVFDEVDAGIGGRVASSIGERLARLAADHQVFCVTHLPQIASYASQHFQVDKKQSRQRTVVSISRLLEEDRVEEIARMMAGHSTTAATRAHASELLEKGKTEPLASS
ncbi:MAG: DNA repair protein RecN [Acidobacteriota bacterium]